MVPFSRERIAPVERVETSQVGNWLKVKNNTVNGGRAGCISMHSLLNGQLHHLDMPVLGGVQLHMSV